MLIILVVNNYLVVFMCEVTPTALPLTTQGLSINHNLFLLQMEGVESGRGNHISNSLILLWRNSNACEDENRRLQAVTV